MIAVRRLLGDKRRSQRGGVLSGVLIILAFLAIISGALMTELSTNFLLSKTLVNRIANEATVNSAIEVSLDQLQKSPVASGCPALPGPVSLNGLTAVAAYVSCAPVVDVRSPRFTSIANSAPFNVDGTHSVIPFSSQDLYLIGDSSGTVYQFAFGQISPNWSYNLGTRITGPPMAMQDAAESPLDNSPADVANLVPIAGGGGGCTANACVALLAQDVGSTADNFPPSCMMPANAMVTSRPAAGLAYPTTAYFGDNSGTLFAYTAYENGCVLQASRATPGNAAIVAGPIVIQNGSRDDIYVVTSQGATSQLVDYTYDQSGPSFSAPEAWTLPYPNPKGIALETTSLPARVAISFAGGGVAIARINTNYDATMVASATIGTGISDAPYWCSCPGGQQIGVGGADGTLYVLDSGLGVIASYGGGSAIPTTPSSDGVGEWFFGANDGFLHEVQQTPGQPTMAQVAQYGSLGAVGSSVQVGACPIAGSVGICAYLGSVNGHAYVVTLDARDATITACLSTAPPACSGVNPRLWAKVEVGSGSSPRTVHVGGWSYYSP